MIRVSWERWFGFLVGNLEIDDMRHDRHASTGDSAEPKWDVCKAQTFVSDNGLDEKKCEKNEKVRKRENENERAREILNY